ncbi:hypothetical protein C8Q77DRAFT_1219510 [Trametes polyzona]|nr:hypothetical protein C8Q77DRAFT_1219510 [Trametes polyzona]
MPVELLDDIVAHLLQQNADIGSIAAFALVSQQFRQVALRRYYAILRVRSALHWVRMCRVSGIYEWVRTLEAETSVFRFKIDGLSRFTALKTLALNFSADGLSTLGNRASLLFGNLNADLAQLKLTHLPRIDRTLLSLVAARFTSLKTLELSCTERLDTQCCWLCLEESSTCVVHSPIPDSFVTVEHLVKTFCNALKPCKKLKSLYLGVFLSDASVLVRHLDRCATVLIASPRTPNCYSTPPFGPDLCPLCCAENDADVQDRESLAKTLFRQALPSLEDVDFSSWFPARR